MEQYLTGAMIALSLVTCFFCLYAVPISLMFPAILIALIGLIAVIAFTAVISRIIS
jgi:hypothetical protein